MVGFHQWVAAILIESKGAKVEENKPARNSE